MSRRIAAMLILAVGFIGFAVMAEDKAEAPGKTQYMYVYATRTDEGPAIFMKIGDQTFVAPKLIMKRGETTYEIIARGKNVVTRRKSEEGDKDVATRDQFAIPLQLAAQVSGASRSKVVQPRDHGPGSGDLIPAP